MLPDLRSLERVAIDTETRDEGLATERGSSWPWGAGFSAGVSAAWRAEGGLKSIYIPFRHPDSDNVDRELVKRWLVDLFASGTQIVFQNSVYDLGWLQADLGVAPPAAERIDELGAVSTLVDENRYAYSLDSLCKWRGLPGKDESTLREAAIALGMPKRGKPKPQQYIWQMPASVVAPYAEADAVATLALFDSLNPVLDQENARAAYRLECDLLPMVLAMRRRGIRIDVNAAEQARDLLLGKRDAVLGTLFEKLGTTVSMAEINRNSWRASTFDTHKIDYPHTEKGAPSFTADWMAKHKHWLPRLIVQADRLNKFAVDFLETYILGHVVNGRVHAEIHPHRSDEGGTRSLRFSYSNPPLQQMPARDKELAPLIRSVFLPEEGEVWLKPDCSQQEFRFICHYAARHKLDGAATAVAAYQNNLDTDFHQLVSEITGLPRDDAKAVNFAKAYRAGPHKFATMIGRPESEAKELYDRYDKELPFVVQLALLCEHAARREGFLTLYGGARRHWTDWAVPGKWSKGAGPCDKAEAIRRVNDPSHPWHRRTLYRADTHKAMNALIQGSAAAHTKLWMREVWRAGITPLLQMHDCLDCSVSTREQADIVAELGRDAVTLEVPMKIDVKFGRSWGDASHTWEELNGLPPREPSTTTPPSTHKLNGFHRTPPDKQPIVTTPPAEPFVVDDRPWRRIPLAALIGQPLTNGKICCPFHQDRRPSMHVYADHFFCFVCEARGDHVDWLCQVEELSYGEAIDILLDWEGPLTPPRDDVRERTLELARSIWREAVPISGTLAERYLAEVRGIDLVALPPDSERVLRFHPNCVFEQSRVPCLLALYRDVENDKGAGIQRIALTPGVFTGGEVQRRTLGSWPRPRAIKLWPVSGGRLYVSEGIETGLAAGTRCLDQDTPMRPLWAAGSAGNMRKLPPLPDVQELVLLVDKDEEKIGEIASADCLRSWVAAGRPSPRRLLSPLGKDFNDFVLAKLRGAS